jgi:tetratricopeptide (TPR) repeat protein
MNRKANVALGQALFDGGYVDSAIWVFEDLRQNYPSDKEVAVMLADVYERAGQVEKALEVHQQIVKLDPGDRASGQRVTELQAMKMQNVFQKGAEAGARNIVKSDKDKKRADRDGAMRTREDVMDAIEDEMEKAEQRPDDPNPRVRVGDLYMRIHDFAKAREQFAKAKEISPTEYRFQMKLDDVKIAEMQHGIKQEKDPEKKKKLYNEMMRFRLESFQKREHHYITDLAIAFELGEIYLAFKKIDEAIKRFQKTSKDPKYRTKSALHLGQAFTEKGQYDLAVRQLSEGIENKAIMDDEKKNLYYIRGTVYEKMGKPEEAKADFMAIYEVEIDFKDVKQKIEGS